MNSIKFLLAIWKTNLLSAMEYRIAFLTQVVGMMANNFIYFAIWIIFFNRFGAVRGWGVQDMYVTFGILASSFGLVSLLFGNAFMLSDVISKGRLDYYLSMPKPVLLHAVSSRMISSGMGDFTYGFLSYALSGYFSWDGLGRYILAMFLAATVFAAFLILTQSLAFWFGVMGNFSNLVLNAMLTFGIYPITLFDNYAKFILFTLIPAALMGAVPAQFVRSFAWGTLLELWVGASVFLCLAIFTFHKGLRRYESGSALQIEI